MYVACIYETSIYRYQDIMFKHDNHVKNKRNSAQIINQFLCFFLSIKYGLNAFLLLNVL